jgi:lysyl-tRNA synthetase class 2
MSREEEILNARKEKLNSLIKDGKNPYPSVVKRSHEIGDVIFNFSKIKNNVTVVGRIISVRSHGKIAFLDIKDETGSIQLYCAKNNLGSKYENISKLDLGDFAQVTGKLFITKRGEKSVEASAIEIISKSMRPMPDSFYGLENLEERHRKRYLDLLSNPEIIDIFKKRSRIISAIRNHLDKNGFTEVETPVLQSLYGGALAKPFTTTHNVLKEKLYLRIAPELYLKRLIVGGFERVYEIGKNFRNEGVSTTHNPEFTMLELYMAYLDYRQLMKFTESLVVETVKAVYPKGEIEYKGKKIKVKKPFKIITFRDIVLKYSGIDIEKDTTIEKLIMSIKKKNLKIDIKKGDSWGKAVDELFKETTRKNLIEPMFVIDYPVELNPLAKRKYNEPSKIERFQMYIGGLELTNAFTELNDPADQLERFKEQTRYSEDEKHEIDKDYVEALEYGMPPTAGLGIGIDRLVMLLTGQESVREVILFPALKKKK